MIAKKNFIMNANNGIIAITIIFLVFITNLLDFKGLEIDHHLLPHKFPDVFILLSFI